MNISALSILFLAVITGSDFAYTRKDGVKVIPIACLKDWMTTLLNKKEADGTIYHVFYDKLTT